SGNTLGERAPVFRGQTVPAYTVLNTTNKQVVSGPKTHVGRNPVHVVSTVTTSYDTGIQQYRDAAAPPALRGTWRGAVNGHGGRGRGRGQNGPQGGGGYQANLAH